MKNAIHRRDFLKLAGLLPVSITAPRMTSHLDPGLQAQKDLKNVLVIVFDAWTSYHISLHGYQRETMPNLTELAERAVVYHNHYAGGNYTTPGTASLLTGTQPWTHRAFQPGGKIPKQLVQNNIFSAFDRYYCLSYSHNLWANLLLRQFRSELDTYIPKGKYFLKGEHEDTDKDFFINSDTFIPTLFGKDEDIALVSWLRAIENNEEGYAYSLFFSPLYEHYRNNYYSSQYAEIEALFPRGIPRDDYDLFVLEHAIEEIGSLVTAAPQPFMGYFHFWPPHAPYNTHVEFAGRFFNDGLEPPPKPLDIFGDEGPKSKNRMEYDEYILYVDREFRRFYDHLRSNGLLENTWIVLTSDHGEMFERGIEGHRTPVLYEPVIRVPLLIFEPGRESREDIYENTSNVDILPTMLHVTGQQQAPWAEGIVLPPFSEGDQGANRSVYVVHADKNEQLKPITIGTLSIRRGDYKLMYFFGYKELDDRGERIELYDLKNDPEELNNIFDLEQDISKSLLNELKAKLEQVNEPYRKSTA